MIEAIQLRTPSYNRVAILSTNHILKLTEKLRHLSWGEQYIAKMTWQFTGHRLTDAVIED